MKIGILRDSSPCITRGYFVERDLQDKASNGVSPLCRAYGVASISRLLKIIGLFCKRAFYQRLHSAKETCNSKEPTNRSHLIVCRASHGSVVALCRESHGSVVAPSVGHPMGLSLRVFATMYSTQGIHRAPTLCRASHGSVGATLYICE